MQMPCFWLFGHGNLVVHLENRYLQRACLSCILTAIPGNPDEQKNRTMTDNTKINRNSPLFKKLTIKALTDQGIKNIWVFQPLCIQKIELVKSGISAGILDSKDFS